MNKEEALNDLIDEINNLDEVKRLHSLEALFDDDKDVKKLLDDMHEVEKKLVNVRFYKKVNASKEYEKELDDIKEKIHNIPLLDEYIELLEECHLMLKNICSIIEKELNEK